MITLFAALLITLSSAGVAAPIAVSEGFDPFKNSFKPIMTPMSEEALEILEAYTIFRNTYPLHLTLADQTVIIPDDENIGQIQDSISTPNLTSATEGNYTIIQNNAVEKPVSIICIGTTTIDITPEKTVIYCK